MILPELGSIYAFAMIVDINGFTPMVSKSVHHNDSIAQFTRDVLSGGIEAVEKQGGLIAHSADCDRLFRVKAATDSV